MQKATIFIISLAILTLLILDYLGSFNFYFSLGFGWSASLIMNKIILAILSIILGTLIFKTKFKNVIRITSLFIIPIAVFGIAFALSPIYKDDFSKKGLDTISIYKGNLTLDIINKKYPNYDGIICLASESCPHCQAAAKKLSIVKERKPSLDITFILFSLQQQSIEDFKSATGATNLQYELTSDETDFLKICEGRFPTFIYVRDNDIIHKWNASEFGYPALDWVESGI